MTTITLTFHFDCKLPDGHRLFRVAEIPDSYAIADDSGRSPDQTDDGVLFLDFERPLLVDHNAFENKTYIDIPLHKADSARTRTITDAATLLLLSERFEWPIRNNSTGKDYKVTVV